MTSTAPERFVPLVVRRRLALAPLLEPEVHTTWAAVLFVDLSNFTRLTESLSGEEGGAEEQERAPKVFTIEAKFCESEFNVTVPELLVKSPFKVRAASALIVSSAPELIVMSSSKTFPSLLAPSSLLITG